MSFKDINVKRNYWPFLSALIVFLDQRSKSWAATNLVFGKFYPVIPQVNFYLTHNKGIAFSLFSTSSDTTRTILLLLSFIIIIALCIFEIRLKRQQQLLRFAFALIIGGAIGNVIDKLSLGYVIDFIDLYVSSWHFATFNIADACISIGAVLLCYESILNRD